MLSIPRRGIGHEITKRSKRSPELKLVIQIPCFNEAETLAHTLAQLPREVTGFETVEWLIIDDGSTDETVEVARANGVDHIEQHTANRGLARAYLTGLDACLKLGASVIVNTDADDQYNADDIQKLTQPIIDGKSDIVIGARPISTISHFSGPKKFLQKLGSWVVRRASNTKIPDAPSGFRAISRKAAEQMMVFSDYTYTLETIIQAGQKNIAITSVPVRVNADLRPSRLVKSKRSYIQRSIMTIIRIFAIYRPFYFFGSIGLVLLGAGTILGMRFVWFYLQGEGDGNVQSLILVAILLIMGYQTLITAFIADLLAANRKLSEDIRTYTRQQATLKQVEFDQ